MASNVTGEVAEEGQKEAAEYWRAQKNILKSDQKLEHLGTRKRQRQDDVVPSLVLTNLPKRNVVTVTTEHANHSVDLLY